MVFESTHVSTTIERSADEVYAYASDPRNLSAWAAGLAERDARLVDGDWVIESPMGRVVVAFAPPNPYGVLDHDVTLPSGETVSNPVRVIPNETAATSYSPCTDVRVSAPQTSPPMPTRSPPTWRRCAT